MNNKITYHKNGDYLIPDLYLKETNFNIGKYGRLRLTYLKENKRRLYIEMMMTETLNNHLVKFDKSAKARIDTIIKKLAEKENVDENLKQANQLKWVQAMNNIKNRAEEIVLNELIYV